MTKIGSRNDAENRFWRKVDKRGLDECWVWLAGKRGGYGTFFWDGRRGAAYTFSYTLLVGPFTAGLELDHLCRNKSCVNPWHLEPVTRRTNVLRGNSVPAFNARKTHCKRGHEFTPDNVYVQPNKGRFSRSCRLCVRAANKINNAKRRQNLKLSQALVVSE